MTSRVGRPWPGRILGGVAWLLGRLAIAPIRGYQLTIGRLLPDRCRFYPSCSSYAISAIKLNGPVIGAGQAVWRLLRCGPWTDGGIDEPRLRTRTRGHRAHPRDPQQDHVSRQNLEATMMGNHG